MKPPIKSHPVNRPEPTTITGFPFFTAPVPAGVNFIPAAKIDHNIYMDKFLVRTSSATFLVQVEGESMIEAFIPNKALLVVDKLKPACTGDIIVATVNTEVTVKRLVKNFKGIFLSPANPRFKSIKITSEMDFKIWGVVVKIIIDPKN